MPLVHLKNLSLSFGDQPLLDNVSLSIDEKEKIALVGRNGTGKSTLLKLLERNIPPDDGEIIFRDGVIICKLRQEIPNQLTGDVRSVIALGDDTCGELLFEYYMQENHQINDNLQQQLNEHDAWHVDQRIKTLISKFDLNAKDNFTHLSGGLKRRVLLARSLLSEPDLLLLDEPTNHLDVSTIEWMEKMLKSLNTSLLIVSHDRSFINKLATRIIDLDRGEITSWPGNYNQYLIGKEKMLEDQQNQQHAFDKKLNQEEVWIRKGIQARRTRNEGRVRALEKMRQQRSKRRSKQQSATFSLNQATKSGQLVAEAIDVNYSHDNSDFIIKGFSTTILRGDKIGIIGPNGCGKSTLIKLLTGELTPISGSINLGTRLEIAYLDQHRSAIQENHSLLDNIAQGSSEVVVNGKPIHVMSYLQEFLFPPKRAQVPASSLSGGERNRLVLAKLFTKPFNLLILDEPTNDLDIDTLELLEQKLVDYEGTLLLISHDRTFLNNIVSSTLVFEADQKINEYVGGYDDWLRQRKISSNESQAIQKPTSKNKPSIKIKSRKLNYKEKTELENLPQQIERMEAELEDLQNELADPEFYKREEQAIIQTNEKLTAIQTSLENTYKRWEELENS